MMPTSGCLTVFVVLQVILSFFCETCSSTKAGMGDFPLLITHNVRSRYYSIKKALSHRTSKVKSLRVYDGFECAIHCSRFGDSCESINYQPTERDSNGLHLCELILSEKYDEATAPQGDWSVPFEHLLLEAPIHQTCADVYKNNGKTNAVYKIDPLSAQSPRAPMYVYCDMQTRHGGWTVIQRRIDGSVDFYRDWAEYKRGFGDKLGEYWLGLDNIHSMTSLVNYKLRIDMEDFRGDTRYAEYKVFIVAGQSDNYRLTIDQYSGNAGDSMSYHNGSPFSTKDNDNDAGSNNCAATYKGAWWYKACHYSNPNGQYMKSPGNVPKQGQGIVWMNWRGLQESLKRIEMKIRPTDYQI